MTDSDVSHLARHLGHDTKTHKEFYRLTDSTIQLSKVCCYYHCLIHVITVNLFLALFWGLGIS